LVHPAVPRWVYLCGVFYVGCFYGLSGLMKWLTSGPGWANGVSMQLWVRLFGHDNWVSRWVVSDRNVAALLQWAALLGETSGLLAVVSKTARPWVGAALIAFHVGQIVIFGWGFHANMALIALLFLPFFEWVPAWVERLRRRFRDPPAAVPFPPTWWGGLRRAAAVRLDVLSRRRFKD